MTSSLVPATKRQLPASLHACPCRVPSDVAMLLGDAFDIPGGEAGSAGNLPGYSGGGMVSCAAGHGSSGSFACFRDECVAPPAWLAHPCASLSSCSTPSSAPCPLPCCPSSPLVSPLPAAAR